MSFSIYGAMTSNIVRYSISCAFAISSTVVVGSSVEGGDPVKNPAKGVPADFHVSLRWSSGSLPPPNHSEHAIELSADGSGSYVATTGYSGWGKFSQSSQSLSIDPQAIADLYAFLSLRKALDAHWAGGETGSTGGACTWIEITANRKRTEIPCEAPQNLRALQREIRGAIESLRSGNAR